MMTALDAPSSDATSAVPTSCLPAMTRAGSGPTFGDDGGRVGLTGGPLQMVHPE
jgi:hypothetical protein